jgi:hypothetical protein
LQNSYNVSSSDDGLIYTFITRFNIKYTLVLIAYRMGEISTFSLSLYPETEVAIFDYWIKNTVIKVIVEFLERDTNTVFYVCDSDDGKEEQRHKVFEYWYKKEVELHQFIGKYNYSFQSENGYKVNSSIIYNKQNYLSGYIIEQFRNEMREL